VRRDDFGISGIAVIAVAPLIGEYVEDIGLLGFRRGASGIERSSKRGGSSGFYEIAARDHWGTGLFEY
jgi:hypothetical protein